VRLGRRIGPQGGDRVALASRRQEHAAWLDQIDDEFSHVPGQRLRPNHRAFRPANRRNLCYFAARNRRYNSVVSWVLLTYRLPAEPTRHRVAVWRELRRVGALSLQQATWAVPARDDFVAAVTRAVELVERAGGEAQVFDAAPRAAFGEGRLEQLFTAEREEEWCEFVRECTKFNQEIDKEIAIEKLTAAELDEEEHNLDRLRRWYRELRGRDVFIAPSQELAEQRLKECVERLEDFAERVYHQGCETR
jgi:hypothetical protein